MIDSQERRHCDPDDVAGGHTPLVWRRAMVRRNAWRSGRLAVWIGAALLLGCSARQTGSRRLAPLTEEAELYVQLVPIGRVAGRLSLTLAEIDAVSSAGRHWPLALAGAGDASYDGPRQVARGRLPPGAYTGLSIAVRRASLEQPDGGSADLLLSNGPGRADAQLELASGQIQVVTLILDVDASVREQFAFEPVWRSEQPARSVPEQVALIIDRESHALAVLDRRSRTLEDLLPIAFAGDVEIDSARRRGFVSLPSEDAVLVLDLASREPQHRIRTGVGDTPTELALTADGSLLICTAPGSQSVLLVDALAGVEINRVEGDDEATSVIIGRGGERAYVLNRRSATISVLDIANRALVTTLATDPEPLWADFSRAGDTMYVIHGSSPNMTVWSLPALAVAQRVFVGLGMQSLRVDRRTDLIYVGMRDEPIVLVYDPFSLAPLETLAVPAPVSLMAVDEIENAMLLLMPDLPAVGVMDLSSRQLASLVDVGLKPHRAAWIGDRH